MNKLKNLLATALMVAACGGPSKNVKEVTNNLPPPPPHNTGKTPSGPPPAVVVTSEQKANFADAVKYFRDQEKSGWSSSNCADAASKFVDAGGDKLAEAYFDAGVAYHKCHDYDNAAKMYGKALAIDPNNGPALSNLCEIAYRGGDASKARGYCESAVANDTALQVTAARNILAWIDYDAMRKEPDATKRKKLEEDAVGNLQRTLAIDNDNIVAYTLMALIYMEGSDQNKSRLDVAKLLLDEGEARNAQYAPLWNAKGLLDMKKGNVASALKDFRQAVQLDPKFFEAKLNLAQIVLGFRKYGDAEQLFRDLVAQDPKSYDSYIGLGVALRGEATQARSAGNMQDFQKLIGDAEAQYSKAMDVDKGRSEAYFNLGLLYKDYRTMEATNDANIAGYMKAKQFFQGFLDHADKSDPKRNDATAHMSDCDKYVVALKSAPPPPPPTAPTPPTPPPGLQPASSGAPPAGNGGKTP